MTEPTTAAGRAMFADFGHPNFVEKWNDAILAIEAEARAAALDVDVMAEAWCRVVHNRTINACRRSDHSVNAAKMLDAYAEVAREYAAIDALRRDEG